MLSKLTSTVLRSCIQRAQSRKVFARWCSTLNRREQPNVAAEKNILTSRHEDCFLHSLSITQRFFERSTLWPDRIAVECGITGQKYTYEELRKCARNFGSSLMRMGFRKGEVLGLVLPNMPEFPVALMGAAGVGMPVTTVNPIYTAEEIARQMQHSEACAIVTVPSMAETMRKVAALCPTVRRLIVAGDYVEGFVTMKDMLNDPGDLFPENIEFNVNEDIFVLPFSSGTTGLPKGVMLTHASVGCNIQQYLHPGSSRLQTTTASHQDTYICVLPFFHVYGIIVLMMAGFDHGAKLVTLPRFEAATYLKALDNHHPTALHIVPPLVTFLGVAPGLNKNSLKRLHTVFCGAAPLGETAATKLVDRLHGIDVFFQEGFGMTELSPVSHMGSLLKPKFGSCGVLVSRTQAKIVDINTREALGPHQEGELLVRGPQVMKGYYKNEKATRETIDPEGWLLTGDIAYYDNEERFYVVDRLKELIKVKGMQVSPSELEDVMRKIPGVLDVAVTSIPDDIAGELPRAYIVKKSDEDGRNLTEQSVQSFVESRVTPHKRLKGGIVFIDSIPKTKTGKILRRELKALAMQNK